MAAIKAHIHFQSFGAAEALEFAVLQDAQKFYLDGGRDIADFVEEQRAFVGQLEFSRLASGSARERALLVAKEFAFEKIFWNGGAVDFYERAGSAVRMLVNRARDQILSDAAFAAEKHGRIRRRDALDERQHGLHFLALRDDVVVFVALAEGFAQITIFFAQLVRIEFLADHQHELGERKRFQHVIARADFHRFDGGFDRSERGHDDDGYRCVCAFHGLQEFDAAHAGQFEVGDDQVELIGIEEFEGSFGVGDGLGAKVLVGELKLEKAAHFGFVFDDEDGGLLGHFSASKTAINLRLESVAVLCFE